jgi:HAD superfamily hydrolase (TIGR01549 family)
MAPVKAVTLDFFDTLARHRHGRGRGELYQDYLRRHDLAAAPWEHEVTYDVFRFYAGAYSPRTSPDAKLAFWTEFTRRLFERTAVRGVTSRDFAAHAEAVRDIFGPNCFTLFDEVPAVLARLRSQGYRLGIISNWPAGLAHFCDELGILGYLDCVIVSAEVGYEKPDPRIFQAASLRLLVPPPKILHVGDQPIDDVQGAQAAGFRPVLLARAQHPPDMTVPVIRTLDELVPLLHSWK